MQFGEREGGGLGQVMVGGQGGKPGELARGLVERVGQPEGAGAVIADVIVDGRALQRRPRQQLQGSSGLRRVFEQGDGTRQVGQGTGGRAGGAAVDIRGEPEAGGLARQVGMACRGQPLVRGATGAPWTMVLRAPPVRLRMPSAVLSSSAAAVTRRGMVTRPLWGAGSVQVNAGVLHWIQCSRERPPWGRPGFDGGSGSWSACRGFHLPLVKLRWKPT